MPYGRALYNGAPTEGNREHSHQQRGERMITVRLSHIAATAGVTMSLIGLILSACVPAQQYNALEADYNQRLAPPPGGR